MLILLILIILTFGTIFLQITGIGASYKIYIDLISASVIPSLALLVTLMSVSLVSFLTAVTHSVLAKPMSEPQFAEARGIFQIIERNLIISTILVMLVSAVGILGGNMNEPKVNWFRVAAAGLLDPVYGTTYLLILQGFKNRLKAL